MTAMRIYGVLLALVVVSSAVMMLPAQTQPETAPGWMAEGPLREEANKLKGQGNWKEAYDRYALLTAGKTETVDAKKVCADLNNGTDCLLRLGRTDELDAYIEKAVAAATQAGNWRLLQAAARIYVEAVVGWNNSTNYGYLVAGKFYRGDHRGGGQYVSSYERDRVRALQLMQQAMELVILRDKRGQEEGEFYLDFASMLMGRRGYGEAWRLQALTDLTQLPDYEEGYYYRYYEQHPAPVDEAGKPVYHAQPKSWKEAASDGQRWRWCLTQAAECSPDCLDQAKFVRADFAHNQFGVQTMAEYGWYFRRPADEDATKKNESGTYELHTLKDDETIAKLASGIKRFTLPDDYNFVKIYQDLATSASSNPLKRRALYDLASLFEDRRQYPRAADYWRQCLAIQKDDQTQKRLDQIVQNWGQFENQPTVAITDKGATVLFRFRNAKKVSFEAQEVDVAKLLADVKKYLKEAGQRRDLEWRITNIADVGCRIVEMGKKEYLKGEPTKWDQELKPLPDHFDSRVEVQTPLKKAGAYLLTATLPDGNISRVIVWVADTAIVKKPLEGSTWYFVCDAVTGKPIAKANVDFFGYWQEWHYKDKDSYYEMHTDEFAEFTDAEGQVIVKARNNNYQWVAIATTEDGRLAYQGFSGMWGGSQHDSEYNQKKAFFISDRPVYRPGQSVKFKFWCNTAKYDQEGKSPFAGETFTVRIQDPKGEKVFEKDLVADEFGGFDGEFAIPADAALGMYTAYLPGRSEFAGQGFFRVEEYKKPEFEVIVDAPKEPVMLGEKFAAKLTAKYYFGAPVTQAKVKYKVLRSSYSADWYPYRSWDWLYGPGYWWFACDYQWYPGWREWGCKRPVPVWWWDWYPREKPEVVAEAEVPVGADGTVSIEIDTAVAKAIYGDTDHKYEITAEVTDASRRTIVGTGKVLVARKPFKVYAWTQCGHYRVGADIEADFCARTLDGKGVKGTGVLKLLAISYKDGKPVETEVQKWALDTNEEGKAIQKLKATKAGQYRLSYTLTDSKKHAIEGGSMLVIMGEGFDGKDFRFNDVELVPDQKEYQPGDKVAMMINTDRADSTVMLFIRPANGVYLPPKVIRLTGKTFTETIEVLKKDMPNFFVEALTVSNGRVHTDCRDIAVPPEKRVMNVEVKPVTTQPAKEERLAGEAPAPRAGETPASQQAAQQKYKPGEKATIEIKITDPNGEPVKGSIVVAIYDKAVEYISGGTNVADIKEFFWKWRRHHRPGQESSLDKSGYNLLKSGEIGMSFLGAFGYSVADEMGKLLKEEQSRPEGNSHGYGYGDKGGGRGQGGPAPSAKPAAPGVESPAEGKDKEGANYFSEDTGTGQSPAGVEPTVRTKFADTALWKGCINTDEKGIATVELTMPENLTTWKTRAWAMGSGARCGEGQTEVITTKNVIVRLEAPRFFVQKDEVVLSAIVHNYLAGKKKVRASIELAGDGLLELLVDGQPAPRGAATKPGDPYMVHSQSVEVDANGEKRVDWLVKVKSPGTAKITVKAVTDEESDAMAMSFPVLIHGMLKTDSYSGWIRPGAGETAKVETSSFDINVPKERLPEQSRLEIRYSPTLAGAMVDALPYMADYPYGCTEQTLNRFLPTVITQKVLLNMGLKLKDIKDKRTNLNAQEIGNDKERAKQWKRFDRNPVFDEDEVREMVKAGVNRLAKMQNSDGGWGWFSGWNETSYPHTTAVVVHGLQIAKANDVALIPNVYENGLAWLKNYQEKRVAELKTHKDWKAHELDAFTYMVLVDGKVDNTEMRDFLYRDRNDLAAYAKAMFGVALDTVGDKEKRDMLIKNVDQYFVADNENQTGYLKLPENNWWWCWYGSEIEADAYYLKLLTRTDPTGEKAPRLVKYLLNNRKHSTYWNSTRDTAVVIEAFAEYLKASKEAASEMTVQVLIDGKQVKEVKIDKDSLFTFDNKVVLEGADVTEGKHTIQIKKFGGKTLYYNAYLTNFTLEDPIAKAGLEIKVQRKYYKLVEVDAKELNAGTRGQLVDKKVEKYKREPILGPLDEGYKGPTNLKSGDLVEVEMEIDSKNDYEYIMFEDPKAAGFEPVELRSGYGGTKGLSCYMELRDDHVSFFTRVLPRGKNSVSYRLRAEIPGVFHALPTKAAAMYAPELRANSDEFKVGVTD